MLLILKSTMHKSWRVSVTFFWSFPKEETQVLTEQFLEWKPNKVLV